MRKSENQKSIQGTARNDRKKRANGTQIKSVRPTRDLLPEAKPIFNNLVKHCRENELLHKIDGYYLSHAANVLHYQQEAWLLLASSKQGLIQKFKNGTRNISPELSAMQKLEASAYKVYNTLGLNAKARENMLSFQEEAAVEVTDPVLKALRRHTA